jgi:2-oxoglutarate dehydrogenase E1 component
MAVVNLSTPAQIFHALRRQVKRDFRKPLIVMSPKSMLRHPMAVSSLSDLSDINFQEVIDCPESVAKPEKVQRVLLCSGKVYYDLVAERANRKLENVAIVRVEQLYPWPAAALARILNRYAKAREIFWVQEEPRNMGAWSHVFNYWMGGFDLFMSQVGDRPIRYVGRGIASSPAVGSPKVHESELKAFLAEAFT